MDRRSFIKSATSGLLLMAAPAIVRSESLMVLPRRKLYLWGDGIHDDTEALQAFVDGKRVINLNKDVFMAWGDTLEGGSFRVSKTIVIANDPSRPMLFVRNHFVASDLIEGPVLRVTNKDTPNNFIGAYVEHSNSISWSS